MFHREKKGNTYATLTHFPGFLQNQSSYCSPSSSGYCGHAVSHRKIRHVFKPWGSNLSQLFRVQFKGVRLEFLAPICKRKMWPAPFFFFLTGGIPPCSRWVCRQTLHQKLSFLVGLSLSLTDAGAVLDPPGSTTEMGWRCTRVRPNSISTWCPALHI